MLAGLMLMSQRHWWEKVSSLIQKGFLTAPNQDPSFIRDLQLDEF